MIAHLGCGALVVANLVVLVWGMQHSGGGALRVAPVGGLRADAILVQTPWLPSKLEQMPVDVQQTAKIDLKQGQESLDRALETAGKQVINGAPVNQQCRYWGPFVGGEADRIAEALSVWSGQVQRVKRPVPVGYVVYLPKDKVGVDTVKALAAKGIRDVFLITSEGPLQGTISLGLFRDMERAQVQKSEVEERGFDGVGIRERLGATRIFFELKGSPNQVAALRTIHERNPRGTMTTCGEGGE